MAQKHINKKGMLHSEALAMHESYKQGCGMIHATRNSSSRDSLNFRQRTDELSGLPCQASVIDGPKKFNKARNTEYASNPVQNLVFFLLHLRRAKIDSEKVTFNLLFISIDIMAISFCSCLCFSSSALFSAIT